MRTFLRVVLPALVGLLLFAQLVVVPAVGIVLATHGARHAVPPATSLGLPGAQDVVFPARDGTSLSGWFVPGRRQTTVLVLHGSHGDRSDTRAHVKLLARLGYPVLAFDARGHGASGGRTNAYGWAGADDVAGAVAYLHERGRARVAALGLSMGAEEALRAAGSGVPLVAVVAEGAGASTTGDGIERGVTAPLARVVSRLTMFGVAKSSGVSEPPPLRSVVTRIRVPVLLIASRGSEERELDRRYRDAIGANATLWQTQTAHTRALAAQPREYTARVRALLAGSSNADTHSLRAP